MNISARREEHALNHFENGTLNTINRKYSDMVNTEHPYGVR